MRNSYSYEKTDDVDNTPFATVGDHIFTSCLYKIENRKVPCHAIVRTVNSQEGETDVFLLEFVDCNDMSFRTADFRPFRRGESPSTKWSKIKYGNPDATDPAQTVADRLDFLSQHPEVVHVDEECLAVWCKTGRWATIEALSWLVWKGRSEKVGGVAAVASFVPWTIPAAGLWGAVGYNVLVPMCMAAPIIPAAALLGLGASIAISRNKDCGEWRELTKNLNEAFEEWQKKTTTITT